MQAKTRARGRPAAGKPPPSGGVPPELAPQFHRVLETVRQRYGLVPFRAERWIEAAVPDVYGRVLPLNVSGAIAAPMLDLGLPAYTLKAIPLLARTAAGELRCWGRKSPARSSSAASFRN